MTERVFLSKAHVTEAEVEAVTRALTGGWVTPLGPEVDAFEAEICNFSGVENAVALSSGTAALHLGLLALGVQPGDEVIVPTLTFGATVFPVTYVGARPVFVDAESESWGLDPELLAQVLQERDRAGNQVAAIIPVDLFGRPANYDAILAAAQEYDVPVLVDAAESLGATYQDNPAGSLGQAAIFSFNGNKIMTTSGGGMFVSNDKALVDKVRFWSTQSREPFPWYQHEEIGYNYRMSNILAALGRAQLERLPDMMNRRQEIRQRYTKLLAEEPGVEVTADPHWGTGNSWLTTVIFDPQSHPQAPTRVREALEEQNIEARPIWKPMHQQPVFSTNEAVLTGVADRIYETGLCLPSGLDVTDADIERVVNGIQESLT